ncbi:MAG: hypothetical protein WBR26_17920, partial [Candidatus Acidiferrum sp.]
MAESLAGSAVPGTPKLLLQDSVRNEIRIFWLFREPQSGKRMKESEIRQLLESVSSKRLTVSDAIARLKHLPFEDIDFAKVDHHRALRQGYAEVVFGKGKTPAQVAEIVRVMLRHKGSRHN